jgi:hypothetical protein
LPAVRTAKNHPCSLQLTSLLRILEDYAVLYLGSAIFKIARLLFIAMLCVHFFACIYYRVKRDTTPNPDDVDAFYQSKYVEQDVSCCASSSLRCVSPML